MVKWHGGGLVRNFSQPTSHATNLDDKSTGTAAYPDWFAGYYVPFLHRNSAISILPNYRLIPEHSGDDILADLSSFWTWLRDAFPAYLASQNPSITPDLSRVLVSGESAGGWCALQSVLTQPASTFRACFTQYPVVNAFPMSPDDKVCGEDVPPESELDQLLAAIKPGTVLSAVTPPARDSLSVMLRAYKRWDEFFGTGKYIMPLSAIEDAEVFVPTFILHGKDDTNVPVEYTVELVEKARTRFPEVKVELATPPGDHGFDGDVYEEDEEWLRDMLRGVEGEWLG
ncbi:Alpha/Beta hydrolase protein [Phaeosphaeria sp. MPI-PUGE-AT-0046c]|nr:Alpha/Beta hydrolase protein [Phaeosphaeria sp. MPI-PUGE-AT-0046c]